MLKAYIVTYNYLGNNHEKLCMDRSQKRLNYKGNSLRQWNCKWKMLKRALITEAHLFPLRKQNNTFTIIFYLCLSFTRCFISGRIPSANSFPAPLLGSWRALERSRARDQSPEAERSAGCWSSCCSRTLEFKFSLPFTDLPPTINYAECLHSRYTI